MKWYYWLTDSMKQSPYEESNIPPPPLQDSIKLLWNPLFTTGSTKSVIRSESQLDEASPSLIRFVQGPLLYYRSIYVHPAKWFSPFFFDQNVMCISHLCHADCMPLPSQSIWFNGPNSGLWVVKTWSVLFHVINYFCGEGRRSRRYGRTAALRIIVHPCDEDD
jgi:hypothetical protein